MNKSQKAFNKNILKTQQELFPLRHWSGLYRVIHRLFCPVFTVEQFI